METPVLSHKQPLNYNKPHTASPPTIIYAGDVRTLIRKETMAKKTATLQEYTGDQIEKLADLDAIRKLAGMYVGNKGAHGLNHILFEVVDNAVDEAMAGFGSVIKVTIGKEGTVTVEDNGRGIPVDWK